MTYNLKPLYTTCSELVTNDKSISTIYGRRPSDGALIPINIDDYGNILLGTGITLDATDLNIGSITLKDVNSSTQLDVIQIGDSISLPPFNGSSDAYRGVLVLGRNSSGAAQPFEFDASGKLLVSNLDVPLSTLEATLSSIKADLDKLLLPLVETFVYGEQLSVASGATVTLITYTIPSGHTFYLNRIEASGDTVGLYVAAGNSSDICKRRSSYAVYNIDFAISSGVMFSAGDIITLVVTNEGKRPSDFNGTLFGRLV